jgi:hypothetical protein
VSEHIRSEYGALRCHHCTKLMGEASRPLVFMGMFRLPQDRAYKPAPRDTYRCKGCGWVNVFQPEDTLGRGYRGDIELKAS